MGGNANRLSMLVVLLPYLDHSTLYNQFDLSQPYDAAKNELAGNTSLPFCHCPSDPMAHEPTGEWFATSYAGDNGCGLQAFGFNGVFAGVPGLRSEWRAKVVRPADIKDRLSNTAAMAEILPAAGSFECPLREIYNAKPALLKADQFELFASNCSGWDLRGNRGDPYNKGRPWTFGHEGFTLHNHVLTPNRPSCHNGSKVHEGAFTSGSLHPSGINTLFADGHVAFFGDSVTTMVWRGIGSRE